MGRKGISLGALVVLGLAATIAVGATSPDLAVGQQWTYRLDDKESDRVLKIIAVGHHPRIGSTFDVQAESLPLSTCAFQANRSNRRRRSSSA